MPNTTLTIDPEGLDAAARALGEKLRAEAHEQHAYLHHFADGKVSMELEWVDPALLARAAVAAYLATVRNRKAQQ